MKRAMMGMIIFLIILIGGIFSFKFVQYKMMSKYLAHFKPPPVTIAATRVKSAIWYRYLESVGSLRAIQGVDLTTEMPGVIARINFESDQKVKAGKLLIQLDDSEEQALLKNYRAKYRLAKLNFNRDKALFRKSAISKTIFDTTQSNLEEAKAGVEQTRANIAKKAITAPFSGKIGISHVDLGQYLSPGYNIVSLQNTETLLVNFNLPEQYIPLIRKGQTVICQTSAYETREFSGSVSAIDSRVRLDTRNILIQATLPNEHHLLTPGMFVSIKVRLPDQENTTFVPQTAIDYNLYGNSVYVLKAQGTKSKSGKALYKVERVYVKIGAQQKDMVSVTSGLNVGDLVATAGQLKLTNGSLVVID